MDDDNGSLTEFGKATQIKKQGLHGGDAVLVPAAHDTGQRVDDDKLSFEREGAMGELIGILRLAQIVTAEGDVMQGRVVASLMAAEDGVEAAPKTMETGVFIHKEGRGLIDGAIQPGLAESDTHSQVHGKEGFLVPGTPMSRLRLGRGRRPSTAQLRRGGSSKASLAV